ncbi:hypothetical protein LCGC14_0716730 [marine sediment metagenome]|uniref:AAA+ ATPase domain-containing protein n=1 Tax=marine sediment metagenome TaxID=412755 RepID=A0A0F9SZ59_9ZZZZ
MTEGIKEKLLRKYSKKNGTKGFSLESFILPVVKTTTVNRIMIDKFNLDDLESYSGYYQIKIRYQKVFDDNRRKDSKNLVIPSQFLNIKEEQVLINSIKTYIDELVNFDEYEFVFNFDSYKYEFVLVTKKDCFLLISLNKNKRAVRNFGLEVKFESERVLEGVVIKKTKIIIEKYLFWQYKNKKNEFYKYPRYLIEKLRPFEKFLESERKAITNDVYKPKAKYVDIDLKRSNRNQNKEVINSKIKEETTNEIAIIRFDDVIPRQLKERRNLVKIVWNEGNLENEVEKKKKKNEKSVIVKIEDWDEEELALIFSKPKAVNNLKKAMKRGKIILQENLTNHRRKQTALDLLKQPYLSPLQNLVDMMLRPEVFSPLITKKVIPFDSRIRSDKTETKNQYKALEKICSSEDLTIIQGPPGSGKTTLIVELVKQAVSRGERVLMCAPTHIAVDNILEMLDEKTDLHLQMVRIGRGYRVQKNLKKYLMDELIQNWKQFIALKPQTLENNQPEPTQNDLKRINSEFLSNVENKSGLIKDMIINTSNLVCGTSSGVVAIYGRNRFVDDFDLMIIDESSKATILEFLIAATRAKRWVIIGDQNQLPPYIEDREVRIFFQQYFKRNFNEEDIQDLNQYARKMLRNSRKRSKDLADWKISNDIKVYDFVRLLMELFRTIYEGTHFIQKQSYIKREWDEIYQLFNYDNKKILTFKQLVEILGSCYHYFYNRIYNVDDSRFQMLDYQYRMPPLLSEFISDTFYVGGLKYAESTRDHGLQIKTNKILSMFSNESFPVFTFLSTANYDDILKTDRRRRYSSSSFNPLESQLVIQVLKQIYETINADGINNCWKYKKVKDVIFNEENPFTIGVISFYAAQFKDIIRRIKNLNFIKWEHGSFYKFKDLDVNIQISIVDRFQGREKDIIIIPLTRSNKFRNIGFLKSRQRANVAFSRAKHNLIIIGNHDFYEKLSYTNKNEPYIKLIKYCRKNKLLFTLNPTMEIIENVIDSKHFSKAFLSQDEKANKVYEKFKENLDKGKMVEIQKKTTFHQKRNLPLRRERKKPSKKRSKNKVVRVISSHKFHMGQKKEDDKKGE